MPRTVELSVMILVKAAPVLTSELKENMCVAAMRLGPDPEWIRLHPIPFRDLEDDSKFQKYQELKVQAIKPRTDRRPESWTPIEGTIQLGQRIGTDKDWATRRTRVASLNERTMCDLIERNRSGSGPGTPSLSVVRSTGTPELIITRREQEQIDLWNTRAEAIAARSSLFESSDNKRTVYKMCPWRFRYRYQCLDSNCNGHFQTIIDWEAVALWRKINHFDNWQERMHQKFIDTLWAKNRDTVLFVGNMEQHPQSFLILGIFWPPKTSHIHQALFDT